MEGCIHSFSLLTFMIVFWHFFTLSLSHNFVTRVIVRNKSDCSTREICHIKQSSLENLRDKNIWLIQYALVTLINSNTHFLFINILLHSPFNSRKQYYTHTFFFSLRVSGTRQVPLVHSRSLKYWRLIRYIF